MKRLSLVLALFLLSGLASAQDEMSLVKFVVLKDYNGKPIRNASVVLHPVKDDGKQSRRGLQLKADAQGKASFDGVPYGKLRIQVLATGFQTYGEDFDIDQPVEEITVRMKRPQEQYSIYKNTASEAKPEDKPADSGEQKPADKPNQ